MSGFNSIHSRLVLLVGKTLRGSEGPRFQPLQVFTILATVQKGDTFPH